MTFSYGLIGALLFLFPGLGAFVGARVGERTELVSAAPEKVNSTTSLFIVVLGTILGHLLGSSLFAIQSLWCHSHRCFQVSFDPSPYHILLVGALPAEGVPDFAIEVWLFYLLLIGVIVAELSRRAIASPTIRGTFDPITFGWLNPAVQAVKAGQSVILAYVVSKTSFGGTSIAYEGIVDRLALDEDQTIKMLVLSSVDRFTIRIEDDGTVKRLGGGGTPIARMQFAGSEIANVALEVITDGTHDVAVIGR